MFWADRVADSVIRSGKFKPYHVDDMKTPSGFAHVGSLMGPVIHSMIYRALIDKGEKPIYTFVMNDFDVMDSLSDDLKDKFSKYMGVSLRQIPSPVDGYDSFAEYYSKDFTDAIKDLGVEAKILYSYDMYREGKFNEVIREALDNSEKILDIYEKVSGSKKRKAGWLPLQVVCEKCGKLGTTKVTDWDGEIVGYVCEKNLVTWAEGCENKGRISPFDGNGKLPWKVDWPAHWKVIGVSVEGAGKDHASKGGSYDIAMALCDEVFKNEKPFKLPYEFVLIGGRKMSSSKGLGLKAHDLVKIIPPQLGRFLYARNGVKSQGNFDPYDKNAIPSLFDDYQKAADAFFNKGKEDLARSFELSQIGEVQKPPEIRFSVLAQWVQMPNMDDEIKKQGLEEWAKYARVWVERFAPEDMKFEVKDKLPEQARDLSEQQKKALKMIANELDEDWTGEDFQIKIYEIGKEIELGGKETFQAIYKSLLGKDHGPKAGWLILSLDKNFVRSRFEEVQK